MKVLLGEGGASAQGFHSMMSILECPKEYQFKERRGIVVPVEYNPDHFSVGSIFGAGRAKWFALKFRTDAKAWRLLKTAMEEEQDKQQLPVHFKAIRYAMTYMQEYVEHYSMRPLPKPIAAEYLIGPAPLKPDDPFYQYRTARLDDVSEYPEAAGLCIGEAKTTSGSIYDLINKYTLHGQTLLQYTLWKAAKEGEATYGPAAGTILDIVKKGYKGVRSQFRRHFIPFEPYVLKWFAQSMRGYLSDMEKIKWDGYARRNFGSCTRAGTRGPLPCEYRDLCIYGRAAAGQYVFKDSQKILTKWKPKPGKETPPWK